MLDHVSFAVKNFEESLKFYDETLSFLGYKREISLEFAGEHYAGYGDGGARPHFWISSVGHHKNEEIGKAQGLHVCFVASSAEAIQKWYDRCLQLGGKDNGAPGPREHYHA